MTRVGELARGLLAFLAIEIGCYALIGGAVWRAHGWGSALLTVLLLGLAARASPVLLSYTIAVLYAEPVPAECRLGLAARVGYALAELAATAVAYSLLQPFAWLLVPREVPLPSVRGRMPVLLVHGYLCNRGVWWSLLHWLVARGHAVYTVDLEPVFGDIDVLADTVAERVDEVVAATGGKLQVIAASMGGLVLRAYLRKHGGAHIARAITLCSPHHGSRHAWLAPGIDGQQLRPGSNWLRALERAEAGELAVPVVSIYSCHDNLVSPVSSGRLDAAHNLALPGSGHIFSMTFSRRVRRALAEHLI
jgi:pimeloyl-ACP methyl ester carboxylesterase